MDKEIHSVLEGQQCPKRPKTKVGDDMCLGCKHSLGYIAYLNDDEDFTHGKGENYSRDGRFAVVVDECGLHYYACTFKKGQEK